MSEAPVAVEIDPKGAAAFAEALYARADEEDLKRYDPQERAMLAEAAFHHMEERAAGEAKIRLTNPAPAPGANELQNVTVVEIVNDDMPFLVDSVLGEMSDRGLNVRLILHPILSVERTADGRLVRCLGSGRHATGMARESFIHIHLDRIADEDEQAELAASLADTLQEVRAATDDWRPMLVKVNAAVAAFRADPPPGDPAELEEAIAFLEWLNSDLFIFLGVRSYAFVGGRARGRLEPSPETGLGLLRDPERLVLKRGRTLVSMTPEIREFLLTPAPLIITKANMRSRVHRRAHMDYVGIKTFDANGDLEGELRVIGLFTSAAYTRSVREIPILRRKVANVFTRAGFDPDGHSGKALLHILETFPRDELFQIDEDGLYDSALSILKLEERPRVRVLTRFDKFERFVSILVFVPRDRFSTDMRHQISAFLAEIFKGRVAAEHPDVTGGPLARMHVIIGRDDGETPRPPQEMLEARVGEIVTTWADRLKRALAQRYDPSRARSSLARYSEAFNAAYREAFDAETAVDDVGRLERLSNERKLSIDFHRRPDMDETRIGLKLYSWGMPIPLSERLPALENMGFKAINERSYRISPADAKAKIWLHDVVLERADGQTIDLAALGPKLDACVMAVWRGLAENDGFNALTIRAGLGWRDVAMLRAAARFLRQARSPFSQDYMWTTLTRHAGIAALIVDLFHARLSPAAAADEAARAEKETAIAAAIEKELEDVASLDEDRILRRFVNVVQSMLRTSFFQPGPDGAPKTTIAYKIDSRKIEKLPDPKPLFEIFVYGPSVEGIHLRFGRIARGGIRWSDRPQDFRTEILGLVKAQQVKNAVIVPVGAKGGFVPKAAPKDATREMIQAAGVAAYKTFIGCLLDVTDNLTIDSVRPPDNVARRDSDDPYLVVAADKGTATFSDTANGIAEERGFWLGDAFASGGSAGYDHKAIGITARGAWEAVKRHFGERGLDVQTTPFTVAGVGDMSGDVFGNGMLLSRKIRLVAAFDHRDIFIDPDPDPETSFVERERLFALPRSSWQDYDKSKISAGGGVFARGAKSIALSAEARALLGVESVSAAPQEVMNAILKARVDLLWFGGIGTYVKASEESDEAVGDRVNDALRVNGRDLRATVVGEGANLGVSQRGRIEFARAGGRINTDAIDNSAGVNTSDVEVNIKIALAPVEASGALKRPARNRLLASMTEEVAALVLRNNILQTLALSLAERRGVEDLGFAQRLMHRLEDRGLLDRGVETLPSDAQIAERGKRGEGLTRPELAVLLAWAKIDLYQDLLESDVPDDAYLSRELIRYFPAILQEKHPQAIESHRLRREIIATMLANSMINRGGPTLTARISDQTGADAASIAAAFAAARDSFGMTALNTEIDALDDVIDGQLELSLHAEVQDLLLGQILWFLRRASLKGGLAGVVSHHGAGVRAFLNGLETALPQSLATRLNERAERLGNAGVPSDLVPRLAALPFLPMAPDVTLVADRTGRPLVETAATFFAIGEALRLDRIASAADGLALEGYYDRLALDRVMGVLGEARRKLTIAALETGASGVAAVEAWLAPRREAVGRTQSMVGEIVMGANPTLAKLSVAAGLVGDLAGE